MNTNTPPAHNHDTPHIGSVLTELSDRFSSLIKSECHSAGPELMRHTATQCKKFSVPVCDAELLPQCHVLRHKIAEYRIADEAAWSQRIINAHVPEREYKQYLQNHFCSFDFLAQESAAMKAIFGSSPRRILFVGSGALPVSPIWLSKHYEGSSVDCLECLPSAVHLSQTLLARLGYTSINVIQGDARTYEGYASYDVVILALLAELNCSSKSVAIARIGQQLQAGSLLVSRTAVGPALWMFPSVQPGLLHNLFAIRSVINGEDSGIGAIVAERLPHNTEGETAEPSH